MVLVIGGVLALAITEAVGADEPPPGVNLGADLFHDLVLVLGALASRA